MRLEGERYYGLRNDSYVYRYSDIYRDVIYLLILLGNYPILSMEAFKIDVRGINTYNIFKLEGRGLVR